MATLNADNYAKTIAVPQEQLPIGDHSGKVRMAYDEITLSAELAVNDLINVCGKIPEGARIVDAMIVSPSLGTTGQLQLGYSSDADYLIALHDAGGAAAKTKMASEDGLLVKNEDAIQLQLKCIEASDAGATKKIKVAVFYVLE
jgi:hypothetical protein